MVLSFGCVRAGARREMTVTPEMSGEARAADRVALPAAASAVGLFRTAGGRTVPCCSCDDDLGHD